jgi:type IV pilus assembly protein PilC
MKFSYIARTQTGELQFGTVEAVSREYALDILTGHDLFVVSLESLEKPRLFDQVFAFLNRVKRNDLVIFTRQFAVLLQAKVPLADSLKTLEKQTKNVTLKGIVMDISTDIEAGLALSQAIEKHSNVFGEFYVNMVRSAEITGRLEEVMEYLADYLEKEAALVSKVRNALIYPAIVVALFILVAAFLITTVMPKIQPIFAESGVNLPFITRLLIASGAFMVNWWWVLLLGAGVIAFVIVDYLRTEEGKAFFDEFTLKLPFVGSFLSKFYVARLSEAISVLLKGGVPVSQSVEVAAHTIGNFVYQDMLKEASRGIERGELLSQVFEKNPKYFPPLVVQMTAIGENTGKISEMLSHVNRFYSREVDYVVSNLVEFIQPALMIAIGGLVGLLFASILIPLYNLAQAF